MMSSRLDDQHAEMILDEYLDKNFYDVLFHNHYSRIHDKENQWAGIDIILYGETHQLLIDEKAAVHYINKDLKTFTFELQFINRIHKLQQGWLYDKHKVTQEYAIYYIQSINENYANMKVEDIISVEVLYINRNKLIQALETVGLDEEHLDKTLDYMRKNQQTYIKLNKDVNLQYSPDYQEQPINVKVSKAMLYRLADSAYMIYPGSYKRENARFKSKGLSVL